MNNTLSKIFTVAFSVSLFCAVIISVAAVVLKPLQQKNVERDRQKNILQAAGLFDPSQSLEAQFKKVRPVVYDFRAKRLQQNQDPASIDPLKMAKSLGDDSINLDQAGVQDLAKIGRRENQTIVYLVNDDEGQLNKIVLPIRGYGLWSTLYGFLALEEDANTIAGIGFYQHAETPGLGGEVDNPKWKQLWVGKSLSDGQSSALQLRVIKGVVDENSAQKNHLIDGLAGATLTTKGVDNLVQFWLGESGFQPLIKTIRAGLVLGEANG